jgi:hypothetical protein
MQQGSSIAVEVDDKWDVTVVTGEAVPASGVSPEQRQSAVELATYKLFQTTNPGTKFFCRLNPATGECV